MGALMILISILIRTAAKQLDKTQIYHFSKVSRRSIVKRPFTPVLSVHFAWIWNNGEISCRLEGVCVRAFAVAIAGEQS